MEKAEKVKKVECRSPYDEFDRVAAKLKRASARKTYAKLNLGSAENEILKYENKRAHETIGVVPRDGVFISGWKNSDDGKLRQVRVSVYNSWFIVRPVDEDATDFEVFYATERSSTRLVESDASYFDDVAPPFERDVAERIQEKWEELSDNVFLFYDR